MLNNYKMLIGYDNKGTVYDSGKYILRKTSPEYIEEIRTIFKVFKESGMERHGFVETFLEEDDAEFILRHKKYTITYPFEWTANMFKDAALFQLALTKELDISGLTLKDALPNNIVFDACRPVFVDFFSLVTKENLVKEEWLGANRYADARFAVFDRMFIPYIFIPFMAMNNKDYRMARELLLKKACNSGASVPTWNDVFPMFDGKLHQVKASIIERFLRKRTDHGKEVKRLLRLKNNLSFMDFNNEVMEFINNADVTPPGSAYASYYQDKNEDFDFEHQVEWTNKQKNIYRIINETRPKKVLDIGANTGWFSIMAEKLGSEVIATDIDESSIDLLYNKAKKEDLKILPLLLSFDDLEKKIFGVSYDEEEYKDRDFKNTPLFMPATERINSDAVLCLGLIHHLVLGMGKDIDSVIEVLSKLTERTLVLEFVSLKDKLVQGEPTFFKNINMYSEVNYNIDIVMDAGRKHFKTVKIMDSDPETRKLLVFDK